MVKFVRFEVAPNGCPPDTFKLAKTDALIDFAVGAYNCQQATACDTVLHSDIGTAVMQEAKPNLAVSYVPLVTALQHKVCVDLTFTNNKTQREFAPASNVYVVLPEQAPYLTQWQYSIGTGALQTATGQVIALKDTLPLNSVLQVRLCADYDSCIGTDTLAFSLRWGWNCAGVPLEPFDVGAVCYVDTALFRFTGGQSAVNATGKVHDPTYVLCRNFEVSTEVKNGGTGGVYPKEVHLDSLVASLPVQCVLITNCVTSQTDTLHTQTGLNTWVITGANMAAIGYADSALFFNDCMRVRVVVKPTCAYLNVNKLPVVVVNLLDLCNDTIVKTASRLYVVNNTTAADTIVWSGQSDCMDCFTLSKTADFDTVAVGDTVVFTIEVCSHNAGVDTALVKEKLPNSTVFTLISSTPAFPVTAIMPADTCVHFTVTGVYTNVGSCPDSLLTNNVSLESSVDTLYADVCVNVLYPCTNASTFIINDSTYSTALNYRYDSLDVYITGRLFVDDTLKFMRCHVIMAPGALITVLSGGYLDIDSSTVTGCNVMWRGIKVEDYGEVIVHEGSIVADADTVIVGNDKAKVKLQNANLKNFVIGVYVPVKPSGLNGTNLNVQGSTFDFMAYKQDYSGQAVHGVKPEAGIVVNDMVFLLGGSLPYLNHFNNLNTGLVGRSSIVTVKRSRFTNIQYDSFKTNAYRGTAIVNVKSSTNNTTKLTVLPEAYSYHTVDSSYRGIYTDGSSLSANYVHLLNVNQGVLGMQTPSQQTSMVTNCTITTTGTGIFWVNNPIAKAMMAIGNDITVNAPVITGGLAKRYSRGAIYMSETAFFKPVVYAANNNTITLNNAWYGIISNATLNSKIKENMIRINQSSGNIDVTGIELNSNYNSSVSCNTIKGDYAGGTTGITSGIFTTQCIRTNIVCNTTDSTYRGVYFGGVSPQTTMKGNEMNSHYNGVYLNSQAIIWPQPHRGNAWYGPFNNFGAVNMNLPGVQGSTFYVDSTLSSDYKPTVNILGWFQFNSGYTFYCWQQPTICNNAPPALLSLDSLEIMIVNGTLESEEYADETRAITQEYLYRELAADSALWQEDSAYVAFMLSKMGEPVSYLNDVEEYFRAAYSFDSVFVNLIDNATNQMELFTDSINKIDEWRILHSQADADSMLHIWAGKVNFLNQTILNLSIQREASVNNNLAEAELQNEYVVSGEIPELNTAHMNEIEIGYIERGEDIQYITDNYESIYAIAQQCPYAGGHAVIRARVWLSMLTDSIEYNDNAVCLQSGIYRLANGTTYEKINDKVIIQPNPAGDYITVTAKSANTENCKIEIINNLNQIVLSKQLNCNNQERIDISKINQGLYTVKIILNNDLIKVQKLIIQR
jgi:hypothetical protein